MSKRFLFPWTVVHLRKEDVNIDVEQIVGRLKANDVSCISIVDSVLKTTFSHFDPHLKKMLEISARNVKESRCEASKSCLVELLAGLQYSSTSKKVGFLRLLIKGLSSSPFSEKIISKVRLYCETCLSSNDYKDRNAWFKLRVSCMDFYVISLLSSLKDCDLVIYYAGSSHTRATQHHVSSIFGVEDAEGGEGDVQTMSSNLKRRASEAMIEHVADMLLFPKTRLLLLGENHGETRIWFAQEIISFLQTNCNSDAKITFLVEKHIFNQNDTLQQKLSCNQENAIHKSRCHPFVETDSRRCSSLVILPVDNRHYDLGFFRMEIMDLWDEDEEYKKEAIEFQRKAFLSILECLRNLEARREASDSRYRAVLDPPPDEVRIFEFQVQNVCDQVAESFGVKSQEYIELLSLPLDQRLERALMTLQISAQSLKRNYYTINGLEPYASLTLKTILSRNLKETKFQHLTSLLYEVCYEMEPFADLLRHPVHLHSPKGLFDRLKVALDKILQECVQCDMEQVGSAYEYPYFKNFYYLIYYNFLIEFYCVIQFAFISQGLNFYSKLGGVQNQSTACRCIFRGHPFCDLYRYYKTALNGMTIVDVINTFTAQLDSAFEYFIVNLQYSLFMKSTCQDVGDVRAHLFLDDKKTVNVNWKRKLSVRCNMTMEDINTALDEAMKKVSTEQGYHAEGMGFFSYSFLTTIRHTTYTSFGSCITFSCLELYIMSRMRVHPQNIFLRLERAPGMDEGRHPYYVRTQDELGVGLSHWATQMSLLKKYPYRSTVPKNELTRELSLEDEKQDVFKALILPIFDSYDVLLQNCDNQDKKKRTYMDEEASFFLTTMKEKFEEYETRQKLSITSYIQGGIIDSIKQKSLQVHMINRAYTISEPGNLRLKKSSSLLYTACVRGDVSMVQFLCSIYGVDLVLLNEDGNTCVHGAILGSNGRKAEERIQCLTTIKDTFERNGQLDAWKRVASLKNKQGETPAECIQSAGFSPEQTTRIEEVLKH